MTCSLAMIGAVCVLSVPVKPEPIAFAYGKATNRAEYAVSSFAPVLPVTGPVLAFKPAQKQPERRQERKERGLQALAYASAPRASSDPFRAITGKGKNKAFAVAHSRVDTSCFPKRLVGILRDAKKHFKGQVIITSGYRSKSYNRKVRGVRNSQHINCKAADVRILGVSKVALAKYFRKHPQAGGVGIYRSRYVHVDTGRKRSWDWR
jgi:hypothetical protein